MIKIHAGLLKGRIIKRPNVDTTKETASMVREAVFNMLYNVEGNVLDLFAGSGSYGITAYSLGAKEVYLVDNNYKVVSTLKENLNNLKIDLKVFKTDYLTFLKNNNILFDYIFLDPPYDFKDYENLLLDVSKHLSDKGIIILEIDKKTNVIDSFESFSISKNKAYGSKRIVIYEKLLDI